VSGITTSERIDRAWLTGYRAGREEWRKIIPVSICVGAIALLCRKSTPVIVKVFAVYALLLATLVALIAAPVVLGVLLFRAVRRRGPASPMPRPELSDGDEPF
jgi:hypothetical protein